MSTTYDLHTAARAVAGLLPGIADDQLTAPTPCPQYRVRDLLFHLLGLSVAFRDAARKDLGPTTSTAPTDMTRSSQRSGGPRSPLVSMSWPPPGGNREPGRA